MKVFIIKLAVAVVPLLGLIAAVTITAFLMEKRHSFTRRRTRRAMLRALAVGAQLR